MRDVRLARKNQTKKVSILSGISLLLVGIGACFLSSCSGEPALTTFCRGLPDARLETLAFREDLVIYTPPSGRHLASVSASMTAIPEPSDVERASWFHWTEVTLKKTQWARDSLEFDPQGKKALSALNEASLSLVSLHGFIDQGKWKRVSQELEKIDETLGVAYAKACPASTKTQK